MSEYSIAEAKAQLSAIVEMVENGEPVTLTKRGVAVVKIVPVNAAPAKPKPDFSKLAILREMLAPTRDSAAQAIRRLRDGEKKK